jgi:hypothetical protein
MVLVGALPCNHRAARRPCLPRLCVRFDLGLPNGFKPAMVAWRRMVWFEPRRTAAVVITVTHEVALNVSERDVARLSVIGCNAWQLVAKGNLDTERRAAVIAIFRPYQPLVSLDDGSRDGQSHAHSLRLAGEKRLEDLF